MGDTRFPMHDTTPYGAPDGLFRRLKSAGAADWQAYTWHPFVQGIASGSLPMPAFRRYLVQDYLFLVQFVRANALAAYKAESLAAFREKAGAIGALLHEMTLHVGYCAEWGIPETEILAEPEAPETVAYTRWVLDRGMAGDILDLEVALAPLHRRLRRDRAGHRGEPDAPPRGQPLRKLDRDVCGG